MTNPYEKGFAALFDYWESEVSDIEAIVPQPIERRWCFVKIGWCERPACKTFCILDNQTPIGRATALPSATDNFGELLNAMNVRQATGEKKPDGGQAFPALEVYEHHHEDREEPEKWLVTREGMSLRDWFAGQCLAGQLSHPANKNTSYDEFARDAYAMADAILAERNKGNE